MYRCQGVNTDSWMWHSWTYLMLIRYWARATDSQFPLMVMVRSRLAGASRSSQLEIRIMAPLICLELRPHQTIGRIVLTDSVKYDGDVAVWQASHKQLSRDFAEQSGLFVSFIYFNWEKMRGLTSWHCQFSNPSIRSDFLCFTVVSSPRVITSRHN